MSLLRVMSYNVLHFENVHTHEIDYAAFAAAIRECGAEIVGLNEVYGGRSARGEQAQALSEILGWHWYFSEAFLDDGTEPFGNAIVSRYPIENPATVPVPYPEVRNGTEYYEPRAVLRAQIAGHTFLVTHFGLNPDEQENALQTVLPLLTDRRCILMGDFNVTPDHPILEPIRARMQDVDAFLPAGTGSFPSDDPQKKIDYIFTSFDYAVTAADIPALVVSDHRPYTAVLSGEF